MKKLKMIWRDNRAATSIEYGLIAAGIVIAAMAAFLGFSDTVVEMFARLAEGMGLIEVDTGTGT